MKHEVLMSLGGWEVRQEMQGRDGGGGSCGVNFNCKSASRTSFNSSQIWWAFTSEPVTTTDNLLSMRFRKKCKIDLPYIYFYIIDHS